MKYRADLGIAAGTLWLPTAKADIEKWPVVACDQYTSQPDYWTEVEGIVGNAPSTLHMIFPEIYLEQEGKEERIAKIQQSMEEYVAEGIVAPAVEEGFILVERTVPAGKRLGLMMLIDLEAYDFSVGSTSLIRATEGTIIERIPPRVAVRQGATLELPHIMLLIDDKEQTVIEPIYNNRESLRQLYDVELMQNGGHLTGWAVEGDVLEKVFAALSEKKTECGGLLYAVGDGNHSLATARQCWLNLRDTLSEEEKANHPARFAMIELVNLYSEALIFEPIHRNLFHVNHEELWENFLVYTKDIGKSAVEVTDDSWDVQWIVGDKKRSLQFENLGDSLPVAIIQRYLDQYLVKHPETTIDYIHGAHVVEQLCKKDSDTAGMLLKGMDKTALFPFVRSEGSLPRKTFSMGEAYEKRYYMECRKISQ